MKNVGEILSLSCQFLEEKGIKKPRRDIELLLCSLLKLSRIDLYVNFERPLEEKELKIIREGVRRLAAHEPLQYIEGKVSFLDCTISVDKRVLIPRPETEELTEKVITHLATEKESAKVLDLCCGSGCIACAIKKALPLLEVYGADISSDALDVARGNCVQNNVAVDLIQSDLFSNLKGKQFDYIVCNPPYIGEHEKNLLDESVLKWEPKLALFAKNGGLEFYERIAKEAPQFCRKMIWFEIGPEMKDKLLAVFAPFKSTCVEKDLSGKDRFLTVVL